MWVVKYLERAADYTQKRGEKSRNKADNDGLHVNTGHARFIRENRSLQLF